MNLARNYGLELSPNLVMENAPQFFGIECEIESVRDHGACGSYGFNVTEDGSLRNHGYEYISIPQTYEGTSLSFRNLHGTLVLRPGGDPFSQRTSIHVHANCANLELDEVRHIILMYALFEEAFFLMVRPDRRENIHCTPLVETFMPNYYRLGTDYMISRWHKYSALNLKPLTKYGTLEFRHMHGHKDAILLDEWLIIIRNLIQAGRRWKIDRSIVSEERLKEVYQFIFGQSRLANNYTLVRQLMANSLLDIKLAVM